MSFVGVSHETRMADDEKQSQRKKILDQIEKSKPKKIVIEGYSNELPCIDAVRIYLTPEA